MNIPALEIAFLIIGLLLTGCGGVLFFMALGVIKNSREDREWMLFATAAIFFVLVGVCALILYDVTGGFEQLSKLASSG
jgi:multisubunit Na+/H+ antiporter MnhB subunit